MLEMKDALRKRNLEKDDGLAEIKVKRDAGSKKGAKRARRAKRDQEEKDRREREQDEAEKKKLDDERLVKRDAEEAGQREKGCLKYEEEAKQREAATGPSVLDSVQPVDSASQSSTPLGSIPTYASLAHSTRDLPESASTLPPSLDPEPKQPILRRLSCTSDTNIPQPSPSTLASARIIKDISKVSYPEGIKAPSSELNLNATSGKFR
jgi:translation initiation factor 4G